MSVVAVNELKDFTFTKYGGDYLTMTAEDIKYIHSVVNWAQPRMDHPNGLTFVLIFHETLLAVDRSYPLAKQILNKYIFKAIHPPLINFDFDLVFQFKTGANQPEQKLSEVLAALGYNGKRIRKKL